MNNDTDRLSFLSDLIQNCPDVEFYYNDDADTEDDDGMRPLGFTIRLESVCAPLAKASDLTLRGVIDKFQEELTARNLKGKKNNMKQSFKSIAEWDPKHGFQNNQTYDYHETREQAEAVCKMLERQGLGGERIHFPIKTWVEGPMP